MAVRDGIEFVACKTSGERIRLLALEPMGGQVLWTELARVSEGRWAGVSTGRVDASGDGPEGVARRVLGSPSHRVDDARLLPDAMVDAILSPLEPYALAFVLDGMDSPARDPSLSDELPEGVSLPGELQDMRVAMDEAATTAERLGRGLDSGHAQARADAMGGRVEAALSRRGDGAYAAEVACDGGGGSTVSATEEAALESVQAMVRAEMLRLLAEHRDREEEEDERRDQERDDREARHDEPDPRWGGRGGDGAVRSAQ